MLFPVVLPLILAPIAFALPGQRQRPPVLLVGAALHSLGVLLFWLHPPAPQFDGWLALDAPGKLVLTVTSVRRPRRCVYCRYSPLRL